MLGGKDYGKELAKPMIIRLRQKKLAVFLLCLSAAVVFFAIVFFAGAKKGKRNPKGVYQMG